MNGTKRWQLKPVAPKSWRNKFPEINPIILQLLYNRNLTKTDEINDFLTPDYSHDVHDPFLFRDMKKAVTRIWQAVEDQENIVVFGDYDADGVCSTAILTDFFHKLEVKPEVIIPHRSLEGYGLNKLAVKKIIKAKPKLLITLDCGSTNVDEVTELQSQGIDVVIIDHHHEPESIPQSFALLNCAFSKEKYPSKNLAAGGMVYKLIQALVVYSMQQGKKWDEPEGWEKWYLDLVAIATVADMVPLLGENRTLVKYGLLVLNKTKRVGLKSIINLTSLEPGKITERHLGFVLGPRINAAGRMRHAQQALDLLLATDAKEAMKLAKALQEDNSYRQKTTDKYVTEARQQVIEQVEAGNKILFAFAPNWNVGLVGLVAGKLLEEFRRPVMVMSKVNGEIKGSGRSIKEFDITSTLDKISDLLSRYGGHVQACGFTLLSNDKLEDFKNNLITIANKEIKDEYLVPDLRIDLEVELSKVDWGLYKVLEQFSPFGQAAPVPRFLTTELEVVSVEPVGLDQKHLRINVADENYVTRKTIAFGFGLEWKEKIAYGDKIDLVYEVEINEWNGNRELQLKVVDIKLNKSNDKKNHN